MKRMKRIWVIAACALVLVLPATAQKGGAQKGGGFTTSNLPVVNSLSPNSKEAGMGTFIMTVSGSNFTTGSVVRWKGSSVSTGYISSAQLNATVSSSLIANTGTADVSVYTSGRKGGTSNSRTFTIATPTTTAPPPAPAPAPSPSPLSITTTSLPGGTAHSTLSCTVAASGGTPAYGWSLVNGGGSLPPGLTLQATGAISGTPTESGTFTFTTQANDSASQIAQKVLSIVVAADPTVPPPPPPTTGGTVLFQTSFENASLSDFNFVYTTSQVTLNSDPQFVRTGKYSAKIYFNLCGDSTNTACGGTNQDSNRYMSKYFNPDTGYPNGLEEVYARGYVYIPSPLSGGTVDGVQRKLIYWMDNRSSWTWTGIVVTDSKNGVLPVRIQSRGVSYWDVAFLDYNRWYCIELRIKPNTPGVKDGILALWVDGAKVFERTDVDVRGAFTTGVQVVRFGEQTNRYNYNPIDEYRYWDDIVISTGYVGP